MAWRNAANTADLTLGANASNELVSSTTLAVQTGGGGAFTLGPGASTNSKLTANGGIELDALSNFLHPARDNAITCGAGTFRWTAVYATAGTINTSSIKDKDPAGDLDPEAALAAVLRTPARRFACKGSERVQSGYYLEEADPLFTIGPPGSGEASATNDTGVLLAAVQALAARVRSWRGRSPSRGPHDRRLPRTRTGPAHPPDRARTGCRWGRARPPTRRGLSPWGATSSPPCRGSTRIIRGWAGTPGYRPPTTPPTACPKPSTRGSTSIAGRATATATRGRPW